MMDPQTPGARDDTRSRSRSASAQDGTAGDCSARNAFPRVAGAAPTRGAQPPGHRVDQGGQAEHYLGRTEEECIAAGQTSICQGCAALGHRQGPSRKWGAPRAQDTWGRDTVTGWREELGYDPITGEVL